MAVLILAFVASCGGGGGGGGGGSSSSSSSSSDNPAPASTPTPEPSNKGVLVTIAMPDNSAYAVLAGPNDYPGGSYDLDYCGNDALDFRNSLVGSAFWNGANVTSQSDIQVTKAKIQDAITSARNNIASDGLFIFFFSGHGTHSGSIGYIVPYDGISDSSKMISETELQTWLGQFSANVKKAVYIDSCYSGDFIDQKFYKTNTGKIKFARVHGAGTVFYGDFAKDLTIVSNLVCVTASKGSELAQESSSLQNGVFTYYIVQGLGSGATIGPADADISGSITSGEVHTYTSPRASAFNSGQTAQIKDSNSAKDQAIKQ